jgi:hypothetical protein
VAREIGRRSIASEDKAMVIERFRAVLADAAFRPFVIRTAGGRSYRVKDGESAHIVAYPGTVIVATREQGFNLIGIASIEAVEFENGGASTGK